MRTRPYKRIRRNRYARVFKDGEGAWNLRARGTVDDGARFMTTFQPLIDAHFKQAKTDDRVEPIEACPFDALIEMADRASDTNPDADDEAQADTRQVPGTDPRGLETLVRRHGRG